MEEHKKKKRRGRKQRRNGLSFAPCTEPGLHWPAQANQFSNPIPVANRDATEGSEKGGATYYERSCEQLHVVSKMVPALPKNKMTQESLNRSASIQIQIQFGGDVLN
jgi:hypothetical protein